MARTRYIKAKKKTLKVHIDMINLYRPSGEVDQLLSCLSKKYVEKLTLQFWKDEYILPASLFSCLKLTHLDLGYCVFQPPLTFRGFSHLVSLKLDHVSFDAEEFGSFLTCCPNLETLSLDGCNFSRLEVSALNLKSFYSIGNGDSVCLKHVPIVEMVSIQPEIDLNGDSIKFSGSLPDFFEPLADADYVPEDLPLTLIQLKNLKSFDISFRTLENVLEFLSLSSNLKRFTMQLFDTDTGFIEENFVSEKWIQLSFYQLEQVEIYRIAGRPTEMEFIELLFLFFRKSNWRRHHRPVMKL